MFELFCMPAVIFFTGMLMVLLTRYRGDALRHPLVDLDLFAVDKQAFAHMAQKAGPQMRRMILWATLACTGVSAAIAGIAVWRFPRTLANVAIATLLQIAAMWAVGRPWYRRLLRLSKTVEDAGV